MNTVNNILNTKIKTRKQGAFLLLISIGFSVISVIGLLWYSLARGCGYGHSFFLCSGVGVLIYVFLFVNLILIITAIIQLIKPFFGENMIRNVFILYLIMILSVIPFDFFASKIKTTEQDCALTGLYNKKDSEYCYFGLAQNKKDSSYCYKSGKHLDSCLNFFK